MGVHSDLDLGDIRLVTISKSKTIIIAPRYEALTGENQFNVKPWRQEDQDI